MTELETQQITEIAKLSPFPMSDALKTTIVNAYHPVAGGGWGFHDRVYHSLEHILAVAKHFSQLEWQLPNDVFGAVLFHDAVYDVRSKDNEIKSAHLALEHGQSKRTADLILLTSKHGQLSRGDVDPDAAQFLDCDMAILAADSETYAHYEYGVAMEYLRDIDYSLYEAGRRQFLEGLLKREHFFFTSHFDEARARENIKNALKLEEVHRAASHMR